MLAVHGECVGVNGAHLDDDGVDGAADLSLLLAPVGLRLRDGLLLVDAHDSARAELHGHEFVARAGASAAAAQALEVLGDARERFRAARDLAHLAAHAAAARHARARDLEAHEFVRVDRICLLARAAHAK